jgi:hypothetical protein
MQELRQPLPLLLTLLGPAFGYVLLVIASGWLGPTFGIALDAVLPWLFLFQAVRLYDLGLMGLGHATADERSKGWLRLRRASPMRPVAFFIGKLAIVMVQALLAWAQGCRCR